MGTAARPAPAVRLSADGAEPAGGRDAAEHQGPGGRVALEDRTRQDYRADLSAGTAGETAEAAGPQPGRRAGTGQRTGLIVANWVEGKVQ